MKQYALITGASKGIGKAMAIELAQAGYGILLVSRSETELQQLAAVVKETYKVDALWLAIDLSEKGAAQKVADWVKGLEAALAVLINNAGFGLWGTFETLNGSEQLNIISLNIAAMVDLTHLLIPALKNNKQAYILNVASTAAYQAVPGLAVYAASKAFVLSFSRAIGYELRKTPISVSCLSPGPTDTDFTKRAGMDALADIAEKFNAKPEHVARTGIKGMFKKKAEIIPGFLNIVSAYGARHLSKKLVEAVTARLYKL
jgi:short-subunit dehydrogenase